MPDASPEFRADAAGFAESPERLGIDPARLEALLARARREVDDGLLPSAQIAVAREGEIVAMQTVGRVTHLGVESEATDDTLYCVFSATKGIISAAAWLLIESGDLDVSERAADIVPEFGSHGKHVVTVEQLFTHTAGFPLAPYPQSEWLSREKRLERFASWRLEWEPGSRFVYHATATLWVIAEIIERRTGVDYRAFVRKQIAEPLGLLDMHVGIAADLDARMADIVHVGEEMTAEERRALGYPEPETLETEVTPEMLSGFNVREIRAAGLPGGGGVMTAAELALFYQALLSGRSPSGAQVFKPRTLARAREIRSGDLCDPLFGKRANRALGVVVAGDGDRNYRGFGHTCSPDAFGHNGAGGQLAWADPATGLSIGYLTNGHDRHAVRQARRGIGISSRAASLVPGQTERG